MQVEYNEEQVVRWMNTLGNFRFPKYSEIPDVGLFLEQTTKYISGVLEPLCGVSITSSMISNYVKKKLIANPVKKQYTRDQIAYLIFIAVAKSVLSLEHIQTLIGMQKSSYSEEVAYTYFCEEFENVLGVAFGAEREYRKIGAHNSEQKTILRNTIIAVANKVYLEKILTEWKEKNAEV